jgi:hypothetical protein
MKVQSSYCSCEAAHPTRLLFASYLFFGGEVGVVPLAHIEHTTAHDTKIESKKVLLLSKIDTLPTTLPMLP